MYTICKTDSWWEAAAEQRELSLVLCDDLESWDEGEGEGLEEGGDMCIHRADSPYYTAETQHCEATILH